MVEKKQPATAHKKSDSETNKKEITNIVPRRTYNNLSELWLELVVLDVTRQ